MSHVYRVECLKELQATCDQAKAKAKSRASAVRQATLEVKKTVFILFFFPAPFPLPIVTDTFLSMLQLESAEFLALLLLLEQQKPGSQWGVLSVLVCFVKFRIQYFFFFIFIYLFFYLLFRKVTLQAAMVSAACARC